MVKTVSKRKRQTFITPGLYKDSVVDKLEFERNAVNVIASTGVSFCFFENPWVIKLLTDLRPAVGVVFDSVEDAIEPGEEDAAFNLINTLIEEESEDENIDSESEPELVVEEPANQPRITINLPNPNYHPIDENRNFWKTER